MTIVLQGLNNFMELINQNWTLIIVCVGLAIGLYRKIKSYISLSTDEKVNIAKQHIQETILKLITDAEEEYTDWVKAGSIKRSQVINEIFEKYPILSKVTNQEELIEWIDNLIDTALIDLRDIVEQNKENESK